MILYDKYLFGNKIYLGPLLDDDLDVWYKWFNDSDVLEHSIHSRSCGSNTKETQGKILDDLRKNDNKIQFGIRWRENNALIGVISLTVVSAVSRVRSIEILIGNKNYWKRGVATEAINLLSCYAFGHENVRKLVAGASRENIGSVRAFEKNGFVREGVLIAQEFINNTYRDMVLLAKFKGG